MFGFSKLRIQKDLGSGIRLANSGEWAIISRTLVSRRGVQSIGKRWKFSHRL